jgi:hypothetical protein
MLLFLERRRQRARWIETEAESLIQHLGPGAFDAASRMEREAKDFSSVLYWRSVRKAIARETKVDAYQLDLKTERGSVISLGAACAIKGHRVAGTPCEDIDDREGAI